MIIFKKNPGEGNRKFETTPESATLFYRCDACPPGRYSVGFEAGAVPHSCKLCPFGKYSAEHAQSECKDCGRGKIVKYDGETGERRVGCELCPASKFNPSLAQENCADCNAGYVGSGGESCNTTCPGGKYWKQVLTSTMSDSVFRTHFPSFTKSNYTRHYLYSVCEECPRTKYSPYVSPGDPGATSCVRCTSGKFAKTAGLKICQKCSEGRYIRRLYVKDGHDFNLFDAQIFWTKNDKITQKETTFFGPKTHFLNQKLRFYVRIEKIEMTSGKLTIVKPFRTRLTLTITGRFIVSRVLQERWATRKVSSTARDAQQGSTVIVGLRSSVRPVPAVFFRKRPGRKNAISVR